jgi:Dolichyl-phosphate-mannose-protein mannosyltransferase
LEIGSQIAASPKERLKQCCAWTEQVWERYEIAIVLSLSAVYFAGTILRARAKPFWFDEILTLLAARQRTYAATIQAARDFDWTPPFTDLVGHFVHTVAGSGEIVFRLPSMIGFWVFCLCLFAFAARRVNIFFALSALFLPFVTTGESYSFEARSYGMMLGFCGIALLSWQLATGGRKRVLALTGICLGVGGAVLCHYYAVMMYLPLAGAEVFRSLRKRKIDKAIWVAFILGAIPLAVGLFAVMHVAKTSPHPVVQAARQDYLAYYQAVFGMSMWFLIPVLVLWAAWLVAGGDTAQSPGEQREIPDYEWLAVILLILVPVAAITVALVVPPHVFIDRYALPSIGGFALLTSLLAGEFAGRRPVLGVGFVLPAFLIFGFVMSHGHAHFQNPFQQEPMLVSALERGPVVVNNYVSYLRFWYYAPEEEKPRLLYLSDEDSSVKYSRIDDIMLPLQKYGVPVLSYKEFAAPGKDFFLYFTPGFGWVPEKALDDGGSVEVVEWSQGNALLHIRLK